MLPRLGAALLPLTVRTGSGNNTLAPENHSFMKQTLEIEVKLASANLDCFPRAGFVLKLLRARHFEDNWLLDLPDQTLLGQGAALRVRSTGRSGLITFKGMVPESASSVLKIREEIETEVSEPGRMVELLERVGFQIAFRYQKYRTVYSLDIDGQELEVAFDETPLGNFIEIEGDGTRVLKVLEEAGFSQNEIIRESYPELQALSCKQRGVPREDLVF
jgi:adenylate cyclase class 2